MTDLFMYLGLSVVGYLMWRMIVNKPLLPFKTEKKKSKTDFRAVGKTKEIEGSFSDLIGLHQIVGNGLLELKPENGIRMFTGAIKCNPINYQLRSIDEQAETDNAYEHLLASLSLGPGREVKIATHIQSRPIELEDQLKEYYDTFPTLDPVAQRYAQSMFFPFLEQWQNSVDEFDYVRYFFVILEYNPKTLEGLDEELILAKAQNEFVRLSNTIISNYARMGGIAEECGTLELLEAMYFATHKRSASVKAFRSLIEKDGRLSTIITSNYSRNAYRYIEEEEGVTPYGNEVAYKQEKDKAS